jgi:flagellar basal body-associated protein FliL
MKPKKVTPRNILHILFAFVFAVAIATYALWFTGRLTKPVGPEEISVNVSPNY